MGLLWNNGGYLLRSPSGDILIIRNFVVIIISNKPKRKMCFQTIKKKMAHELLSKCCCWIENVETKPKKNKNEMLKHWNKGIFASYAQLRFYDYFCFTFSFIAFIIESQRSFCYVFDFNCNATVFVYVKVITFLYGVDVCLLSHSTTFV